MKDVTINEIRAIIREILMKESNMFQEDISQLSPSAQEDLELVKRVQRGDESAFKQIMNRYEKAIYFNILKTVKDVEEAEDLTSITFQKIFANIKSFKPEYAFSTWLFNIAKNTAIDFLRKKQLDTKSIDVTNDEEGNESGEVINVKDTEANPEEKIVKSQKAELVRKALAKLAPKYKDVLKMRYFDGLSMEEIAEKLGIPVNTVKVNVFRAKSLLNKEIEPNKEQFVNENEQLPSTLEDYKKQVRAYLLSLEPGEKLMVAFDNDERNYSDFMRRNFEGKFPVSHTADAIRGNWYGV